MLCVIKGDAWRAARVVEPYEVGPLVAEIITDKHFIAVCDLGLDDSKCRVRVEGHMLFSKRPFFIDYICKQGFWAQVAQERLPSVGQPVIAKQCSVDIGKGKVVEEQDEPILPVNVSAKRHSIRVLSERIIGAFDLNVCAMRELDIPQGDARFIDRDCPYLDVVGARPKFHDRSVAGDR